MKSTLWVKRIVLVDGNQSGKGRPAKTVAKSRTCLYIPIREHFGNHTKASAERPYNPSKNQDQRKQFKRTNMSALKVVGSAVSAVEVPISPAVAVNLPIEAPAIETPQAIEIAS